MGPFTIVEKQAENCYILDIPAHIRGRSYPVFHSSDLILYESRIIDPIGMLPDGRWDEVVDDSEGGDGPSGGDGQKDDSSGGPVLV